MSKATEMNTRQSPQPDKMLRANIASRKHEELVELLMSMAQRFPELRESLEKKIKLKRSDVQRMIRETKREIRKVTAEPGWGRPKNRGCLNDYRNIKQRLNNLIELGEADAAVTLGEQLLNEGLYLLTMGYDDDATADGLHECSDTIMQGVVDSSLSPVEKILFVIDTCLRDSYDVIDSAAINRVLESKVDTEVWSGVAETLQHRLDTDQQQKYERQRISDWLTMAIQRAGRDDELMALHEREAEVTGDYRQLTALLMEAGEYHKARQRAAAGIALAHRTAPGIAWQLADMISAIAQQQVQWRVVAAHAAWRLFQQPTQEGFTYLLTVAGQAKCIQAVRKLALQFLETGQSPIRVVGTNENNMRVEVDPDWPLPVPEHLVPLMEPIRQGSPHFHILLEMALAEDRLDDALHWYEKLTRHFHTQGHWGWFNHDYTDRVAQAVTKSHPLRALEIYEKRLGENLDIAQMSAYETSAKYLGRMYPIMKRLGRDAEWKSLIAGIRQKYARRYRFMELLDRLEKEVLSSVER